MDIVPGVETVLKLNGLEKLKDKLAFKSVKQTYSDSVLTVNMV